MSTTAAAVPPQSFRIVQAASVLFLALLGLYLGVLRPRPYFVTEIDLEHDYLYNAKLIHQGQPIAGIHHPGTPIYHLGDLILNWTGDEPAHAQRFFDVGYACILVANAAALLFFIGTVLRRVPPGVSALAVCSLLAWPPFLLYTNQFGADSFVPPASLITLALLWRALQTGASHEGRALFLCGLSCGVCLAIKTSFLPVVFAAMAAGGAHVWNLRGARSPRPSRWAAAAMPAGALLSYLVCTASILPRLPNVWLRSFERADARPRGGLLHSLASVGTLLLRFNALFLGVSLFVIAAVGILCGLALRKAPAASGETPAGAGYDVRACALFLALTAAGLVYTLSAAASDWGPDAESRLRNATPCVIVLPLAIVCGWQLGAFLRAWDGRAVQGVLGAVGASLVAWSLARHVSHREGMIREHLARQQAVRAHLDRAARGPGRIAFWTLYLDHLGEMSFHFWGNYRYAYSLFDESLLRAYPCCTLLRLRDIGEETGLPGGAASSRAESRYGALGSLAWSFRKWMTRAQDPYSRQHEAFAGGARVGPVSLAAFLEREDPELGKGGELGLRSALEAKWTRIEELRETIAGEKWRLMRPAAALGGAP